MKKLFLLFGILTTSATHAAMDMQDLVSIDVTIENIKTNRGGQLVVFVFSEHGFPRSHKDAVLQYIKAVDQESTVMKIKVPARGHFALKVLHDENKDLQVTKNWTGIIPRDGMGFSNGARIRFAPPKFSDARITYSENTSPRIILQYF
ncbi:MAG: DUF2141 domain-containing protein [Gammaproteobacteria bacterium]|nr:DUF2141 domain-containing protein [Gammaproteobacteria bacterium]MDH5730450.1 DUF2141 domain-containing protein [Gammaproteobacteria bacterium]